MTAEEALPLSCPAITARDAVEWPEAINACSLSARGQAFGEPESAGLPHPAPQDYCIINSSKRMVNFIVGTAQLSNLRGGVQKNEESVSR